MQPIWERLLPLVLAYMNIGAVPDSRSNGEQWAVANLVPRNGTLFDVGANVGEYATMAKATRPDLVIHSIEPLPAAATEFSKRLGSRAVLHQLALGERDGSSAIHTHEPTSSLASFYERRLDHHGLPPLDSTIEVTVRSLDSLCTEFGVEQIDLLKLDVEGHELAVLRGASRMIAERRIRAVQFEFGGANIDSKTFLQDIWYLTNDAFQLHRLLPGGLRRVEYHERWEQFQLTTFVALMRDR